MRDDITHDVQNIIAAQRMRDEGEDKKRMRKEIEQPHPRQRRRRDVIPVDVRKKKHHGNIWEDAPDDNVAVCIPLLEEPRQYYTKKHVLHPQHCYSSLLYTYLMYKDHFLS